MIITMKMAQYITGPRNKLSGACLPQDRFQDYQTMCG